MTIPVLREELHQQVEILPEDLIQEVVDFVAFVLMRRQKMLPYQDWQGTDWQEFTLQQFFRETDQDVQYLLADAEEVYHP